MLSVEAFRALIVGLGLSVLCIGCQRPTLQEEKRSVHGAMREDDLPMSPNIEDRRDDLSETQLAKQLGIDEVTTTELGRQAGVDDIPTRRPQRAAETGATEGEGPEAAGGNTETADGTPMGEPGFGFADPRDGEGMGGAGDGCGGDCGE